MTRKIDAENYIEKAETVNINHYSDNPVLKFQLEALLNRAFVADEKRAEEIADGKILDIRIKQVSDLITARKFLFAQELLQKIRDEEDKKGYTQSYKAKVANNLGVCALHLNNVSLARKEFNTALELEPNSSKILGNAAMAAFINNDIESALDLSEKSRLISRENSQATTVYIQVLNEKGRKDDIEQLLKDEIWILSDASCLLALGIIYYLNHSYGSAENYLREALTKDTSDPQVFNLLSVSIFHPIVQQLQDDPPLPWKQSNKTIERIEEAKVFAEKEVDLLKNGENRKQYHYALTNRAQINSALGHKDEALKDCDKVLAENDKYDLALNTKGVTLFHLGKYKESIECLNKVADFSTKLIQINTQALAYVHDGQIPEAIQLLEENWELPIDKVNKIHIAEALSLCYEKLPQNVETKLDEIFAFLNDGALENNVDVALIKSDIYYFKGRFEEAKNLLIKAFDSATDNQKDRIHLVLANQAFYQSKWKDASEYYSLILNSDAPLTIKQQYAISLLKADEYEKALSFCQSERTNDEPIPVISEIEAGILEYKGDLPFALDLRLRLHETTADENETHLIKACMLALRQGKEADAKEIILKVNLDKVQDSPNSLSYIAQTYTILGIDGGVQLAYKARKLGFQYPEHHLSYLRVFLAREDSEAEIFRPQEIQNNCVAEILFSDGEKQTFRFTDEEPEDIEKNIICKTNPLALKFLGKKVGDEITLKENSLQTLTAKILEIKSKYVYAFQESILKFSTWFPDNEKLYSIDTSNNDFSVIFSQLDKRYAHVHYVMQLHNEQRLPLSVLAKVINRSRIITWSGMVSDYEDKIFASIGNINDIEGNIETNRVVLDLVGILSANYLGVLEKLPEIFDEIYVPQAVLDELNEELINERIDSKKLRATLSRVSDGYQHYEYTSDELNKHTEFLKKLRDFITNKTNVVPTSLALSIQREELDELSKILGESAIASILVAKEKNALLYADDLSISQFAKNNWNVKSVWSQVIIANLRNKEIITEDEYNEGVYKLIIANYQYPAFNLKNFLWGIRKNDWKINSELQTFMRVLEMPGLKDDWVVEQCADLIKQSVLEVTQMENRFFFLDFILKTLIKGRNPNAVLAKLKAMLSAKCYLLPIHLVDIFDTIDLWRTPNHRVLRDS